MTDDLKFQNCQFSRQRPLAGGTHAEGAFKATSVKRQMLLSPASFHANTTDPTLSWELAEAIDPLKELLK